MRDPIVTEASRKNVPSVASDLNDLIRLTDGRLAFAGTADCDESAPDGTGDEDCTNNGLPALVAQPPTNVQGTPGVATNNTDAIIGIVNPAGGAFPLLNRIGGDGNDGFHGMLELSGFLYVGGRTSSTNVDLESPDDAGFTPTFAANAGGTDGLLGRVPLSGGAWRATYYGGTGDEVINCLAPFLEGVFVFGTTASDDDSLPTSNVGIGTFFDATHNGGGTPLP